MQKQVGNVEYSLADSTVSSDDCLSYVSFMESTTNMNGSVSQLHECDSYSDSVFSEYTCATSLVSSCSNDLCDSVTSTSGIVDDQCTIVDSVLSSEEVSSWSDTAVNQVGIVCNNNAVTSEDVDTLSLVSDTTEVDDQSLTHEREEAIFKAISGKDIEALRNHAISEGGLINDKLRKEAWPLLLGIVRGNPPTKIPQSDLESYKEYSQVVLDVDRSLKRFPPGIEDDRRIILQDELTRVIVRVLREHPHLHYYQGYHDIAITFLLVVGEEMGVQIMEKLSISYLREFMEITMEKTTYLLNYIYPIIRREKLQLHDFLEKSEIGTIFCLPWLITWYGHTLSNYRDVVRLYDYFLAQPPLMPMYLAAAIVLYREKEVLKGECDMAYQHQLLSNVPDDLPFEMLLVQARELYSKYNPNTLEKEVQARMDADAMLRHKPEKRDKIFWFSLSRWISPPTRHMLIKTFKWPVIAVVLALTVAFIARSDHANYFWSWYANRNSISVGSNN